VPHQPRRRSLGAEAFGRRGRPGVPLRVGPVPASPSRGSARGWAMARPLRPRALAAELARLGALLARAWNSQGWPRVRKDWWPSSFAWNFLLESESWPKGWAIPVNFTFRSRLVAVVLERAVGPGRAREVRHPQVVARRRPAATAARRPPRVHSGRSRFPRVGPVCPSERRARHARHDDRRLAVRDVHARRRRPAGGAPPRAARIRGRWGPLQRVEVGVELDLQGKTHRVGPNVRKLTHCLL
jgi:hypothetical protein